MKMRIFNHGFSRMSFANARSLMAWVFACACVLSSSQTFATTWYVAANGGSDSNDGKTEKTAFATILKAYSTASSGDEIIVDDGTYDGFSNARLFEPKITIRSRTGWRNTIVSGALGFLGDSANLYVVLVGFTVSNATYSAVIGGCRMLNCRITHCQSKGGTKLLEINSAYNCIIDNNSGGKFQYGTTMCNCTIYNNAFTEFAYAGGFRNCILVKNSGGVTISSDNVSNSIQYESSFSGSSMYGLKVPTVNPLLYDAANGDYRLLEGSPCIDAGDNSYASGDYDIGGNARIYNGTVDIGAYEWRPTIPAGIEKVIARQRYPWNGLVDLLFTVTGESDETYDVSFIAKDVVGNTNLTMATLLDAKGSSVSASDPVVPGTYRWIWNAAADLPDGFKCDRVTVTGTVEEHLGGVQLWENGPYWAECNVGATKPEESGYYFWWGDTVGYKRNSANDGWISVKNGATFEFEESNCPTYGKDEAALSSLGYVDSAGNLVAAHDAATTHAGASWRMPTAVEMNALESNCDTKWTEKNGVVGRLVTGRGLFIAKSIFLPASGYGGGTYLDVSLPSGNYWSSTPYSGDSRLACGLYFYSGCFYRYDGNYRHRGQSIRAVRTVAK